MIVNAFAAILKPELTVLTFSVTIATAVPARMLVNAVQIVLDALAEAGDFDLIWVHGATGAAGNRLASRVQPWGWH